MIKLVIAGSNGRMGRMIMHMAMNDEKHRFGPVLGFDVEDDPLVMKQGDVIIDFTTPEASLNHLQQAAGLKKACVLGTTGFTPDQERVIIEAARNIAVVKSSNMSLGVNVFFDAAQKIARSLPTYAVHIQETHHIHKKDAPSGTALQVGKLIEEATEKKVTYESFREGEVVGDHRVIFKGPADRIELVHHAESRDIFAAGALQAAQWVAAQKPGLYKMSDVLGL